MDKMDKLDKVDKVDEVDKDKVDDNEKVDKVDIVHWTICTIHHRKGQLKIESESDIRLLIELN